MVPTRQDVPQILSISAVSSMGTMPLKKATRRHLGTGELWLTVEEEILLSADEGPRAQRVERRGNRLVLPQEVREALSLDDDPLVALIQREGAVALKRIAVASRAAERAALVDVETARTVTRTVHMAPWPEEALPHLAERLADASLRADVWGFVAEREILAAWQVRGLLEARRAADDEVLRQRLIVERLDAQQGDGSWQAEVPQTARHLLELAALGLDSGNTDVARGAAWLLERAESPANPGMFFLNDELVARQAQVLADRAAGRGGRFRELREPEIRRVAEAAPLARRPCGPRLMWPTALALEALTSVGYGDHPRVRRALRTLSCADWCECAFQHGSSGGRLGQPMKETQVAALEQRCRSEYRHGGLADAAELLSMDASQTSGWRLARISRPTRRGHKEHPLAWPTEHTLDMPLHVQGCELMITKALAQTPDLLLRRMAQAHLWRFASRQNAPGGTFGGPALERYFYEPQIGMLDVLAAHGGHPVAQVAILRLVPWIIAHQNADGSWGDDRRRDASTLAVVTALSAVRRWLPEGFWDRA